MDVEGDRENLQVNKFIVNIFADGPKGMFIEHRDSLHTQVVCKVL